MQLTGYRRRQAYSKMSGNSSRLIRVRFSSAAFHSAVELTGPASVPYVCLWSVTRYVCCHTSVNARMSFCAVPFSHRHINESFNTAKVFRPLGSRICQDTETTYYFHSDTDSRSGPRSKFIPLGLSGLIFRVALVVVDSCRSHSSHTRVLGGHAIASQMR